MDDAPARKPDDAPVTHGELREAARDIMSLVMDMTMAIALGTPPEMRQEKLDEVRDLLRKFVEKYGE